MIFSFALFVSCSLIGQNKNLEISSINFNKKFLEHLIKIKVDSVRQAHNCKNLINDSILYIASSHHSEYMIENNKLSHYEDVDSLRTPQLRAEHYGAKNYGVGENVLKTSYNLLISTKKKKKD